MMLTTPFIETFPANRWYGYIALVWVSGRIYHAFFGAKRDDVMTDAALYIAAYCGRGVEP